MDSQIIHSNFETIESYDQNYRISTKVVFKSSGRFKCKALLFKQNGGKVRGEPLYKRQRMTRDEGEVELELQDCVDACVDRIEDIERAKLLEIDVTVK